MHRSPQQADSRHKSSNRHSHHKRKSGSYENRENNYQQMHEPQQSEYWQPQYNQPNNRVSSGSKRNQPNQRYSQQPQQYQPQQQRQTQQYISPENVYQQPQQRSKSPREAYQQQPQYIQQKLPQNNYNVGIELIKQSNEQLQKYKEKLKARKSGKTISLPNGDEFTGELMNGKYEGDGEYYYKTTGLRYVGEFSAGKQNGYGILFRTKGPSNQVIYDGEWRKGSKYDKEGKYYYRGEHEYYVGGWANDMKSGQGTYYSQEGVYKGNWVGNKREGKGTLKLNDGIEYIGQFVNDVFVNGTIIYPNGDKYNGQVNMGKRQGKGTYQSAITGELYEGDWKADKRSGKGFIKFKNGNQLAGTFESGNFIEARECLYKWIDGTIFKGVMQGGQAKKGTLKKPGQNVEAIN